MTLTSLLTLTIGQLNVSKQLQEVAQNEPFDVLWQRWNDYTRHYMIEDANLVAVRCGSSEVSFGFQYTHRPILVQTPLTHEAYCTCMAALAQGTVFACGPAGTGKTETQKDFAEWIIGYRTYIVNCFDQMDLGTINGLLQAISTLPDSYFCFDEANRLTKEVWGSLLHGCVSAAGHRTVNVAFTYNPGYLGRTERPDVEGLGPTVKMFVPEYELIAEVMLAAECIHDYSAMGHQLVAMMRWCADNLSKQGHYDFGMRALKQVVSAAGYLLRQAPQASDVDEAGIVVRALWLTLIPRCTPADAQIAEAQMATVFPPGVTSEIFLQEQPPTIQEGMKSVAAEDAALQSKLAQFVVCAAVRHGVGVISEEPRKVLQALSAVAPLVGVQMQYIGADDQTCRQLYGGWTDESESEWRDGSFTAALRMLSKQKDGPATWLVVDGPMDHFTMEPLNSLLDDNKKLTLENHEIIPLRPNINIVFIVNGAASMSPANVSRLGWTNFNTSAASTSWLW